LRTPLYPDKRIFIYPSLIKVLFLSVSMAFMGWLVIGCKPVNSVAEAIVYTSVDQPFAEPVLAQFEKESGIRVRAVYDVEAAKTTGLVNRLLEEKNQPQADVFWNSEIIQTIRLKEAGALQPYQSPEAANIPSAYIDPQGYWTGNAARARVLIINTDRVHDPTAIDSLQDLLSPAIPAQEIGIANPLFGTTATHAAALYETLGSSEGRAFFEDLSKNGVRVVDGNSVVRDLVASGQLSFGLTDTDDACGAYQRGAPVLITLPDQDREGTFVIPSTVAIVAGAPHLKESKQLVDFLLSAKVEQMLLDAGYSHINLHDGLRRNAACQLPEDIHALAVDYNQVYQHFDTIQREMRELFLY
jgi:iron(III) transport system substrate-binding protein